MSNKIDISATIVLYNEDEETLKKTINSFLNTSLSKKLFLIDNSKSDNLKKIVNHPDIYYVYNNKNLGFSKGHNFVLNKIKNKSKYHLILNPDVIFAPSLLPKLINEIEKHELTAMITPKVTYLNGNDQYTCRKLPTFFDLIIRRLHIFKKRIKNQEYQNLDLSKPFYPEAVHGCFMLFKTDDFISLKGFDERYFLYLEDIDICKKIQTINKKILYFPKEKVIHVYKKGSSKKIKLFFYHLISAFKYFTKWQK